MEVNKDMARKVYNVRECLMIIKKNGFVYDHSTGGHDMYRRGNRTISLPSNNINPMLFRRLIKENELIVE